MKKIAYFMIAVLFSVLLQQHAVRAAEQETVILTAEQGKAAVQIEIPDQSQGVSTLRLRVSIEGDIRYLDSAEPIIFEAGAGVQSSLLQTRYNAEKGYFTIYLSDTDKITDRSSFVLGYLVPNTADSSTGSLTISVLEDGLEYVDGAGQLKDEIKVSSSVLTLDINSSSGRPEENPGNSDDGTTDGAGSSEDGAADGSAGGSTGGSSGGTTGGSTSGSNGNTNSGNAQSSGNNHLETVTAAKTDDNTSIMPFYAMAVLSASAVIAVLILLALRKRL